MKKSLNESLVVLGLMSGSSLDGVDIGVFKFTEKNGSRVPDIEWLKVESFSFPEHLLLKLRGADQFSLEEYFELEAELSRYYGQLIKKLISQGMAIDLASIHGHTVFHQPAKGFSIQMGFGGIVAEHAGVPVITDFRNNAIAHGRQGAPMVPVLDRLFKSKADFFLNLGGIANLTIFSGKSTLSMDVCGCNQVLDYLASEAGMNYDKDGRMAEAGNVNQDLLSRLNQFPLLKQKAPKSLSNQQLRSFYIPILKSVSIPLEDKMRTMVEHIVEAVACELEPGAGSIRKKLMVSGGGAHHLKLMDTLKNRLNNMQIELLIPDAAFIDFKESLLMAYAGWLRWRGECNFIPESANNPFEVSGGGVYLPANYSSKKKK